MRFLVSLSLSLSLFAPETVAVCYVHTLYIMEGPKIYRFSKLQFLLRKPIRLVDACVCMERSLKGERERQRLPFSLSLGSEKYKGLKTNPSNFILMNREKKCFYATRKILFLEKGKRKKSFIELNPSSGTGRRRERERVMFFTHSIQIVIIAYGREGKVLPILPGYLLFF